MSARVVERGDFLTIDVASLSAELVAALRAHQRVKAGRTSEEWDEWAALEDEASSERLDAMWLD